MTSRKFKGDQYEIQVRNFISIQPDVTQAWLWRLCPEKEMEKAGLIWDYNIQRLKRREEWEIQKHNLRDTGVDIVIKKTDHFEIVQCKNFAGRPVNISDLSTFFYTQLVFKLKGEVYSNSGFQQSMRYSPPPHYVDTKFITFPFLPSPTENQLISSEKDLELRDYQIETINKLTDLFGTSKKRAILAQACGLGKTVQAAQVAKIFNEIIIFAPLRAHAEQNFKRFEDILSSHASKICNENGHMVNAIIDADGIRDVKLVRQFIQSNGKFIISATFKSADVIIEILPYLSESTFIFIDEFHNLTKPDLLDSNEPMNKILTSDQKILFSSATPRSYDLENTEYDESFDEIFGDFKITLPLHEAINRKLVADYRVFIPLINEVGDEELCKTELNISEIDETLLAKSMFLCKAMLYEGARRTITYVATEVEAKEMHKILSRIGFEFFGIGEFEVNLIVAHTPKAQRTERLQAFSNSDGFSIILSINILSECIDIPACDSIFVSSPCKSKIRSVQRLCRANRLDPQDPAKIAKIFLWADSQNDLTEFISAIKEIDVDFPSKISVISRKYSLRNEERIPQEAHASDKIKEFSIDVQEYEGTNLNKALVKANAYVSFHKTNHRFPSQQATDENEKLLAIWANNYRQGLKENYQVMQRPQVDEILDQIENWRDMLISKALDNKVEALTAYIEQHDELPPGSTALGQWLSRQRSLAQGRKLKGGHRSYAEQLDETFGRRWRRSESQTDKQLKESDQEWNDNLKAAGVIRRVQTVHANKMPPVKKSDGKRNYDYTFLKVYHDALRGHDPHKKLHISTVRLLFKNLPHLLPNKEDWVEKYRLTEHEDEPHSSAD